MKRWLASVEQHLAPLIERRVDTLKASDFADALREAWTKAPRIASAVLQRANVLMQWCEAKNLSVNYVDVQRHLAKGDDGSGKMV